MSSQQLGLLAQSPPAPNSTFYISNCSKYSPTKHIYSNLEPACSAYLMKLLAIQKMNPTAELSDPDTAPPCCWVTLPRHTAPTPIPPTPRVPWPSSPSGWRPCTTGSGRPLPGRSILSHVALSWSCPISMLPSTTFSWSWLFLDQP